MTTIAALPRFTPRWRGPIEGYTVKAVHSVLPHLIRHHDFLDVFNEAFLVYLSVKKRYVPPVDNPAWFMALYKRCLATRFADLIQKSKRFHAEVFAEELPDSVSVEEHDGYLLLALRQLPRELVEQVRWLVTAPEELLKEAGARTKNKARLQFEMILKG